MGARSARTSAQSIAYLALSSALPIVTVKSVALETYTSLYFPLVPPTFVLRMRSCASAR